MNQVSAQPHTIRTGPAVPVGFVAVVVIALLTAVGIAVSYRTSGTFDLVYGLMSLFLSINLLISYWEICLFLRRDYIEQRTEYWRERRTATGRSPATEFLTTSVPLKSLYSTTLWADIWSTYALYDGSYADRRTYGFNADVANGFFTLIPGAVLHATYTVPFLPAVLTGILGIALFWQWTYMTSLYWVSFFVAKRQALITRSELYTYIWAPSSPWLLFALLGLYVSVRLIVDGDYSVLGH